MDSLVLAIIAGALALLTATGIAMMVVKKPAGNERVREIGALIQEGAIAFLRREYLYLSVFVVVVFVVLVVADKQVHKERYPGIRWDAYDYALHVLLNRIRGYLNPTGISTPPQADILVESRSPELNLNLQAAYTRLRQEGGRGGLYGRPEEYCAVYPLDKLFFCHKKQNVAGIQVADLIGTPQTYQTCIERQRPVLRPLTSFERRIIEAIAPKVNTHGRVLVE